MRKTRIPRRAKSRAGTLMSERDKLDDMARTLTMLKAGAFLLRDRNHKQWWGACQRCHGEKWLSWCHVFTRATWSTRWDWEHNCWAWCSGCHRYLDQHWNVKMAWVIEKIGQDAFDRLSLRATGNKANVSATKLQLELALRQRGVSP